MASCTKVKEDLEDKFDAVKNNILIFKARLRTESQRIDSEVSAVWAQMEIYHTVLQEMTTVLHIPQAKHNRIVKEAQTNFKECSQKWMSLANE
jgi:hypothetical protein